MGGYFHALSVQVDEQLRKLWQIKQSETRTMIGPRKTHDI